MKSKIDPTTYQRVCLGGTWYVILPEEEFNRLAPMSHITTEIDELNAINMSDQRLADRLLKRRLKANLTQKKLAEIAEIRVETLNRIEKGRTTPDFATIRKLVNATNDYLNP